MVLSSFTLIVALCLSAVAAWYSILGLMAIFSAAVIPIVIMASFLEVAKITVTVWLHEHWQRCKWIMKLYLVFAVVVLMLITSMGIFGFLSKAHSDQTLVTGNVAAQVALIDEKIKVERDTIELNRRALKQLDEAVDQVMLRSKDERGAERSAQIRRNQQAERTRLLREIEQIQKRISALNDERAPILSQVRQVEAEVGPIKYIAALLYGDNPDVNLLERAVRWVIITLVLVFDPLAIMMVLAASQSFRWSRERRAQKKLQQTSSPTQPSEPANPKIAPVPNPQRQTIAAPDSEYDQDLAEIEQMELDFKQKEAIRRWKAANPGKTIKSQREAYEAGMIDRLPWELEQPLTHGFGSDLPKTAARGDLFVLIKQLPSRIFKFNGKVWIEVDKDHSDQYSYHSQYIQHLIDGVDQGIFDPELLSEAEKQQIAAKLQNQ